MVFLKISFKRFRTKSIWIRNNDNTYVLNLNFKSKEMISKSNQDSIDSKRKFSAVEVIQRVKLARRMDDIYRGDEIEYSCMEIGHHGDNTKELYDSYLKLPIVMKDMFMSIIDNTPQLSTLKDIL